MTITLDEVRRLAHERALATDAAYRARWEEWQRRNAEREAQRVARREVRRKTMRRLEVRNPLPNARVWMHGPRWQRAFGVEHRLVAEVAPESARYHRPGTKRWWYDFEADVRELVLEEIRPGVYAEWSDPRERFSV